MITVPFPYLSGLAAAARVTLDSRLPTMGVFASGRMIANPAFVARLNDNDLAFVLAHEMLHLALRTHDRLRGSDPLEFNYAHDYIINDMLRVATGPHDDPRWRPRHGRRTASLGRGHRARDAPQRRRSPRDARLGRRMWSRYAGGSAKRGRGRADDDAGDVLSEASNATLFPDDTADPEREAEATRELAARALGLARAFGARGAGRGSDAGGQQQVVDALRGLYRTPWELALQRWLESVAPGERTFTRASRRGAQRSRRRHARAQARRLDSQRRSRHQRLHDRCHLARVGRHRGFLRCRRDRAGAACSNATHRSPPTISCRPSSLRAWHHRLWRQRHDPCARLLAADPQVRAALVLTDGDVTYPAAAPPFDVLWVLTPEAARARFSPPFGRVVQMQTS